MGQFAYISVLNAWNMLQSRDLQAVIVDIRDPKSFQLSHPLGAFHLTYDSIVQFKREVDYKQPILVMCYHGVSSKGVVQYLINQGFQSVHNVDVGFVAWHRQQLPVVSSTNSIGCS
ncbi:thiosulfate sulfurtransferase GlpE [Candidatus Enterovibrio escicola]|uniref:Thiosulfate sulfurtransferase GlpE n=1 Tax=Candidatus Enterovibrio escicola TaxID=1927127 RepID=A0A2A5T503_9GAMM|nr:thiosulfate sulfurtransferase GlpE [Candidatus Enterovibrio escacola]PCS23259.1 Thiosulfate sulfurtransferase GlpE [Candidatus Enterovibrio escacola]